jgi:hypothetical protein
MAYSQWQMANVEAHKEFAQPAQTFMYSRTARQRPDPTSYMGYMGYMSYMGSRSLRRQRNSPVTPQIGHLPLANCYPGPR